nr:MAG TPA: hypothetical protein [Caudoviricetes sp.]
MFSASSFFFSSSDLTVASFRKWVVSAEDAVPSRNRFSTRSIAREIIWFSRTSGDNVGRIGATSSEAAFFVLIFVILLFCFDLVCTRILPVSHTFQWLL